MTIKIYINSYKTSVAMIIDSDNPNIKSKKFILFYSHKDSKVIDYLALIKALEILYETNSKYMKMIYIDSDEIYKDIMGISKKKNKYFSKVIDLFKRIDNIAIEKISILNNPARIYLDNHNGF